MEEQQYKRPRLALAPSTPSDALPGEGLAVMLLDVQEGVAGSLDLWGITPDRKKVLIRVPDYQTYFYIPSPVYVEDPTSGAEELTRPQLERLQHLINCR
jgi:hypothetical protein